MISFTGHTGSIRSVQYSPDGTLLASGGGGDSVRLWSLTEQREVHCWQNLGASVEAVAFAADGALLVAGLAYGDVVAWDVVTKKQRWKASHTGSSVRSLASHGSQLVSANWGGELWLWENVKKKQAERIHLSNLERVTAVAIHPQGTSCVLACEVPASIAFTVLPALPARTHPSEVGTIYALAYAPDGDGVALGGTQGLQLVATTGQTLQTFVGHRGVIYGVAFTPDGQRLISTGADATTRVWDVATGREMHVYQWHPRWANCLAIAPDGLTVATGGVDQTIVVWDVPE